MGILDVMAQQNAPQNPQQTAQQPTQPQQEQAMGNMQQMHQFLMENSMNAIAGVAEERIRQKGPIDGVADLIATAMAVNLDAAQQNGKTIPVPVMLEVAKDIAMNLLQQIGVPPEELDDVFPEVMLKAIEQFGEMTEGKLPPEEEQQYIQAVEKIAQLDEQRRNQGASPKSEAQPTMQQSM